MSILVLFPFKSLFGRISSKQKPLCGLIFISLLHYSVCALISTRAWSDPAAETLDAHTIDEELIQTASTPVSVGLDDKTKVKSTNFLDKQREFITDQVIDLSAVVDRMLSNNQSSRQSPSRSYLMLKLDSIFNEGGDREFRVRIRGKADLPNTKRRLKLIFESDPENDFSPQENERNNTGDDDADVDRAIAGLEYAKQRKKYQWQPAVDIGTRLNFPVDLFIRVKLKKNTLLGEKWRLKVRINVPYFAREGAKPAIRASFIRSVSETLSFRSVSRYKYTRKKSLHEAFQSFQINHRVSEKSALEYKFGAFGDNQTDEKIDEYFIQLAYKRQIYGDWMFLSFVPGLSFRNEDDWSVSTSFALRLRALYSN